MDENNEKTTIRELIGDNLLDYNISVRDYWNNSAIKQIIMENDGFKKYIYFNVKENRPYTNIIEGEYFYVMHRKDLVDFLGDKDFGEDFFIDERDNKISICNLDDSSIVFSYEIDGKIRSFLGLTNIYVGLSYPIGFDLNKQEFVKFPINKNGLIDDNKMREILNNEKLGLGFDKEEYEKIMQANTLDYIIRKLLDKDFIYARYDTLDILHFKIAEYNYETSKMIQEKVYDKLYDGKFQHRK